LCQEELLQGQWMGMWMGVAKETGDTGHKSGASSDGHLHNY